MTYSSLIGFEVVSSGVVMDHIAGWAKTCL
jgi:hypothetical protein